MKEPTKTLEAILDWRLKNKTRVAAWRAKHPLRSRAIYRRWALKTKGADYKPRKRGAYYGAFDKNFKKKTEVPR